MTVSLRIQLFAVAQVILTALLTYFFVTNEHRELSNQSYESLETFLIQQKQQELRNYTAIAMASIDHIYQAATENDQSAKDSVAEILSSLIYNNSDGYFFVYDEKGNNIVLPTEPHRVGNNYWDLLNDNGEPTIQILIENAKRGGDFYRYTWNQPSTGTITQKVSYSDFLPKWGWMMGTGVYLDNVQAQLDSIQSDIEEQINKTRLIILFIALTSIFTIFGIGALIHLRQKKETDAQISQLGQKIVTLQEEEQRHISRELHDGIVQVMVSIKYSLEATGKQLQKLSVAKPESLENAERNLANAINEIRRISHHLHPRILDELGLSEALGALAAEFTERTGIVVTVNNPAVRKILTDEINTTLYRVVQESLINIEKHANATCAHIELTIRNQWLTLSISDNGDGVSQSYQRSGTDRGIGIRNLAERVEYHQGKFSVKSTGRGTTVIAKIPRSEFAHFYKQRTHKYVHEETS